MWFSNNLGKASLIANAMTIFDSNAYVLKKESSEFMFRSPVFRGLVGACAICASLMIKVMIHHGTAPSK